MLSPFKFSLAAAFTPLYYFIFQHRTICICRWIERFLYRWEIWHCNLDSWMGRRQCCRLWEMPFYPMSWEYVDVFLECSIICSICFFFNQFFVLGRLIAPYSFIDGCPDQWSVFCFRRGFKCQSFADLVLHFPSHFQSLQHLLLQIPYPLSTALHLGLLASQLEMESICLIFVFLDALASPSSHPCQRVGQWLIVF